MRMLVGLLIFALFLVVEAASASAVKLGGVYNRNDVKSVIAVDYDNQDPAAKIWIAPVGIIGATREGKMIKGETFDRESGVSTKYTVDLKPDISKGKGTIRLAKAVYTVDCREGDDAVILIDNGKIPQAHCFKLK